MKTMKYIITILALSFSIHAYASDPAVESAYAKWVEFFDEHLWVVRKYEPDLYSKILDGVRVDLEKRSSRQVLLWNVLRKQDMLKYKYIVYAPLNVLDEFHSKEMAKMGYLISNKKLECIKLFSEFPENVNVLKLIPKELFDTRQLLEKAILAHRSGYQPEAWQSQGEEEYINVVAAMKEKYGAEFDEMINKPTTMRSCELLHQMDTNVSKLPDDIREKVLRYLYAP